MEQQKHDILKNKTYLYLTEFFSGMAIMAVELAKGNSQTRTELTGFLRSVNSRLVAYKSKGYILTDDQAPVELLGMQAIDQIISKELEYYKKMYDEQGLQGIMEIL